MGITQIKIIELDKNGLNIEHVRGWEVEIHYSDDYRVYIGDVYKMADRKYSYLWLHPTRIEYVESEPIYRSRKAAIEALCAY